jgi:hypothetical protein
MKVIAAIIIVITRNTEEADVAGDVKQSPFRIIKSEVMSGFDTTSFFMRKETTPLPVLRENAMAFYRMPSHFEQNRVCLIFKRLS